MSDDVRQFYRCFLPVFVCVFLPADLKSPALLPLLCYLIRLYTICFLLPLLLV